MPSSAGRPQRTGNQWNPGMRCHRSEAKKKRFAATKTLSPLAGGGGSDGSNSENNNDNEDNNNKLNKQQQRQQEKTKLLAETMQTKLTRKCTTPHQTINT